MRTLKHVTDITTVLANITVVISISIAVMTYIQQNEQAKKNAAVSVVNGFNTGYMLEVQRRLSIEFAKLNLGRFSNISIERSTLSVIVGNMVETSAAPFEVQQDIITILSYLDDVAVCVQAETCDYEVIENSMGEVSSRYACILLPYAETLHEELLLEGLGDQLRDMVRYEDIC